MDANVVPDPLAAFGPVFEVAGLLQGFRRPWYVAGGWAIDLFLGRKTRSHADVDIAILRDDQADLRAHLSSWSFDKVVAGVRSPWTSGERLDSPIHELHASREGGPPSRLEFLLNESSGRTWRFRWDDAITRPLSTIGMRTPSGVPFLAPEIVLLFKAKAPAAKDVRDFEMARRLLRAERRRWLVDALATCYLGHPWLVRLE